MIQFPRTKDISDPLPATQFLNRSESNERMLHNYFVMDSFVRIICSSQVSGSKIAGDFQATSSILCFGCLITHYSETSVGSEISPYFRSEYHAAPINTKINTITIYNALGIGGGSP